MTCGAVTAVAADAERGAGVALLPAADEGGLADEGAREADVLDPCGVQHVVDELQAAQASRLQLPGAQASRLQLPGAQASRLQQISLHAAPP